MPPTSSPITSCPKCGTQLAPTMLACPVCARLVHGDQLSGLALMAREAESIGDISSALEHWRLALDLLPAGTKQHQVISEKITELGRDLPAGAIPASPQPGSQSTALRAAAGIGAIGLMFWKFKFLLAGLTKGTTLLTMVLSLGVYWTMWGWKFALGLVLSIYVHEMGHVITLRRYGFKSTAPMFIPGLGALIRLQQRIVNPDEDAAIGLAGPIYGLGAATVSLGLWLATGHPIFADIAGVGALINLFNLLPIGSLDGGRGFHAMSRLQKLISTATVGGAWYLTGDGLLMLHAILCLARALGDKKHEKGNWKATATYAALVVVLTVLSTVRSPTGVGQ